MSELLTLLEPLTANLDYALMLGIGAGALRSVSGWLDNAAKDGQISTFEWKMLGQTMLKYAVGVILFSLHLAPESAVATMFGIDCLGSVAKKAKA